MSISFIIGDDYEALSRQAADRILAALADKPDLLFCAAGGSTPERAYQLLVEHHRRRPADFTALRLVQLDEWGGFPADDPGSCETQLRTTLIAPLGLAADRCFGFSSDALDPEAECARIQKRLAGEGPIDLCILGLGINGHIAMNEPASCLQPFAHVARLTEESLRHPMLANSQTTPTHGLTLGLAEILASREILLLVNGASKRTPLERLLKHDLSTEFPASFLWLHPNCTVLCDRAATTGLDVPA
jgi:galactosamine-6-phosphate isomerase